MRTQIEKTGELPAHLDSGNTDIHLHERTKDLHDTKTKPIVSANAYLGARGIVTALHHGADIVICGRVADASPVIGAAWYWHNWQDTDYDSLAGALVAGHLIECSGYATGANFSGFDGYDLDLFVDLPFGIAEIANDGTSVITKHENTKGMVTENVMKCQFLYELQGAIYLNSMVSRSAWLQSGKWLIGLQAMSKPIPRTSQLRLWVKTGTNPPLPLSKNHLRA